MTRRILVTGGGGFIGSRLLTRLGRSRAAEDEIVSVSREYAHVTPNFVRAVTADLTNLDACRDVVADFRPTHIIHLAAQASVAQSFDAEGAVWRNNLLPTWHLAASARDLAQAPAFIFASSAEVYGASFKDHPVADEETPPLPINAYARSKLAGELLLQDMLGGRAGVVILRFFNAIGAGQDQRFLIPSLAAQIAAIERGTALPVLKVGNLQAERDFMDAEDAVAAIEAVIYTSHTAARPQVFNVASGIARSVRSVVDHLAALARIPFTMEIDPERLRPTEIQSARGDSGRLTAATGWRPQRDWEGTLGTVLDYWRAGRPG